MDKRTGLIYETGDAKALAKKLNAEDRDIVPIEKMPHHQRVVDPIRVSPIIYVIEHRLRNAPGSPWQRSFKRTFFLTATSAFEARRKAEFKYRASDWRVSKFVRAREEEPTPSREAQGDR